MATVFKRKQTKGAKWYIQWFDHTGIRRSTCSGTTDKSAALRIANKKEAEVALRREGVIDARLESINKESQRKLAEHIDDYIAKLRAKNSNKKHISQTRLYIERITTNRGLEVAADIDEHSVNLFVESLQEKGRSARTVQAHLTAIKGFTKWLAVNRRIAHDPLTGLSRPNPNSDRRHKRRMLLPEEWRLLESHVLSAPTILGMTGPERALLYQTAITTGLRSKELRSLKKHHLKLSGEQPAITLDAESTKNRQRAKQFIGRALASRLSSHVSRKHPSADVFNLPEEWKMASMVRKDLSAARMKWLAEAKHDRKLRQEREESFFLSPVNEADEKLDFHALRHTCGAWLAMTGAHPKKIQTIMRHSSITLTMDTYGHLVPSDEANAVADLEALYNSPGEGLAATGTADPDANDCESALQQAQQSGREMTRVSARLNEQKAKVQKTDSQKESPKPLRIADLSDDMRSGATEDESIPGRIRTCDLLIRSQLLYPAELPGRGLLSVRFPSRSIIARRS